VTDWADVDEEVLDRLRERCLALPETHEEQAWTGRRWMVRKKNFAHVFSMYDPSEKVVTFIAFRSPDEERGALVASGHPFFKLGWGRNVIGMVIDDATDWDEVQEIVTESYCVLAPQKLVALVERPELTD